MSAPGTVGSALPAIAEQEMRSASPPAGDIPPPLVPLRDTIGAAPGTPPLDTRTPPPAVLAAIAEAEEEAAPGTPPLDTRTPPAAMCVASAEVEEDAPPLLIPLPQILSSGSAPAHPSAVPSPVRGRHSLEEWRARVDHLERDLATREATVRGTWRALKIAEAQHKTRLGIPQGDSLTHEQADAAAKKDLAPKQNAYKQTAKERNAVKLDLLRNRHALAIEERNAYQAAVNQEYLGDFPLDITERLETLAQVIAKAQSVLDAEISKQAQKSSKPSRKASHKRTDRVIASSPDAKHRALSHKGTPQAPAVDSERRDLEDDPTPRVNPPQPTTPSHRRAASVDNLSEKRDIVRPTATGATHGVRTLSRAFQSTHQAKLEALASEPESRLDPAPGDRDPTPPPVVELPASPRAVPKTPTKETNFVAAAVISFGSGAKSGLAGLGRAVDTGLKSLSIAWNRLTSWISSWFAKKD